MAPPDGDRFRVEAGYMPSFATSDLQLRHNGSTTAPDYDFHLVDLRGGWQLLTPDIDLNLDALLALNIYNPANSAYSSAPGFVSVEVGFFASIHGRATSWLGLVGGSFLCPHVWTVRADVGATHAYHFDPDDVTFAIAPEVTARVHPIEGLSIDAGLRLLLNAGGFGVPPVRPGEPRSTIEPTPWALGLV